MKLKEYNINFCMVLQQLQIKEPYSIRHSHNFDQYFFSKGSMIFVIKQPLLKLLSIRANHLILCVSEISKM
jgi:hypothetical protein